MTAADTDLAALLAGWSERGTGSLPRRLAQGLRGLLDAGLLPPGHRLPPERRLAELLAVSRGTVSAALDELRAEGRIESRPGRGSEVLDGARPSVPHRMSTHFLDESATVNLSTGNPPDAAHLPPFVLDGADLTAEGGGHGLAPQGQPRLIAGIVELARREGLVVGPDEVHVTNGSHHALHLVAEAVVERGAAVVLEDPAYPGALDIIDHLDARAVPLHRDLDGPDPHRLRALLAEHRPALVYLQGAVHNPLGRAPAAARWRAVAEVLDEHEATVVEDRALITTTSPEDRPPPLALLCRRASVATMGSIGKVAWAGLRIGWLLGPPALVERTVRIRTVTDLGTAVPSQIIATRLLPHLDDLASERRATLLAAAGRVVDRLADEAPEWEVAAPRGGSALWIRLPDVADAGEVVQAARRHGVLVVPGSVARVGGGPDPHLRVCVDRPDPIIDEGITRLLRAWRDVRAPAPTVLG